MNSTKQLVVLLGRHDYNTLRHCRNVAGLLTEWTAYMGASGQEVRQAYVAGLLHDIGKLHIPGQLLNKTEQLTREEWSQIRHHPVWGQEILQLAGLTEIGDVILYHHERFDGKGYGAGLAAAQIPLLSRMLAVCDAFDAMTGRRCYAPSKSADQALQEIRHGAGTQFDPGLCEQFIGFVEQRCISKLTLYSVAGGEKNAKAHYCSMGKERGFQFLPINSVSSV